MSFTTPWFYAIFSTGTSFAFSLVMGFYAFKCSRFMTLWQWISDELTLLCFCQRGCILVIVSSVR